MRTEQGALDVVEGLVHSEVAAMGGVDMVATAVVIGRLPLVHCEFGLPLQNYSASFQKLPVKIKTNYLYCS